MICDVSSLAIFFYKENFVIMTTWSCQLGRNTSIGILEAEKAMTLQIMKNGRSPMLACFFTVAENRDI